MTTEDAIAHELGVAQACKVHSIKIAAAPVQHRFAAKAAFINYSSGDKAAILALDATTPAWNSDTAITVREQVPAHLRQHCAQAGRPNPPQRGTLRPQPMAIGTGPTAIGTYGPLMNPVPVCSVCGRT